MKGAVVRITADVCYGGIGWCGHLAYIESGSEAFKADTLEAWKQIGPAGELFITGSGAADIVPESVLDFSWW